MKAGRWSGILLHPTSLPGRFGIGDLGPQAFHFADWLAEAGQKIWQVLPLGPVGYGESPYQLFSAFAGNPMLISPEKLVERGWLAEADVADVPAFPQDRVEFEHVTPWKARLLRKAFQGFTASGEFEDFCLRNEPWLDAFARFMALKEAHRGVWWRAWRPGAQPDAREAEFHKFLQFEFFRQWRELKAYCARLGIRMMGDVAIYAAILFW